MTLLFVSCLFVACSDDKDLEENESPDANFTVALSTFDSSNFGIYKGVFSTADSEKRGNVFLSINQDAVGVATITLNNGLGMKFSTNAVVVEGKEIENMIFKSESGSTFEFSVDSEGLNPRISSLVYEGDTSFITIVKETSRAPVSPTTGVWVCDNCPGGGGLDGGSFSTIQTGTGNGATLTSTVMVGGIPVTGTDAILATCDGGTPNETCTTGEVITAAGGIWAWTGTVTYDSGGGSCSEFEGTWALSAGGGRTGTFVSDTPTTCTFPENDFCANAIAIGCDESLTGSTENAHVVDNPGDNCGGFANFAPGGVWFTYTGLTDVNDITVDTNGSIFDTLLWVYSGDCSGLVCIDGDDDDGDGVASSITFTEATGVVYYFYVGGYFTPGDYTINLTCAPPTPAAPVCEGTPTTEIGDGATTELLLVDTPYLFTATTAATGTIGTTADIENVTLDIFHTYDGDLDITLISPIGTRVELTSGNGGSGNNYTDTRFIDGGADVTLGSAPFTGEFTPEGGTFGTALGAESVTGIWTLEVVDTAGGDTGTLNSWSITFCDETITDPSGLKSAAKPNGMELSKEEYKNAFLEKKKAMKNFKKEIE